MFVKDFCPGIEHTCTNPMILAKYSQANLTLNQKIIAGPNRTAANDMINTTFGFCKSRFPAAMDVEAVD